MKVLRMSDYRRSLGRVPLSRDSLVDISWMAFLTGLTWAMLVYIGGRWS